MMLATQGLLSAGAAAVAAMWSGDARPRKAAQPTYRVVSRAALIGARPVVIAAGLLHPEAVSIMQQRERRDKRGNWYRIEKEG